METIITHILSTEDTLIKCGQIDEKILRELKMITSLYDYIQMVTVYYDDEDRPYKRNWTDIEGMGYGWGWMNYEEKDWHKMMSRMISREADSLIMDMDNTLYLVYENELVKTYHFISLTGGYYREDVLFSFSNKEICY